MVSKWFLGMFNVIVQLEMITKIERIKKKEAFSRLYLICNLIT